MTISSFYGSKKFAILRTQAQEAGRELHRKRFKNPSSYKRPKDHKDYSLQEAWWEVGNWAAIFTEEARQHQLKSVQQTSSAHACRCGYKTLPSWEADDCKKPHINRHKKKLGLLITNTSSSDVPISQRLGAPFVCTEEQPTGFMFHGISFIPSLGYLRCSRMHRLLIIHPILQQIRFTWKNVCNKTRRGIFWAALCSVTEVRTWRPCQLKIGGRLRTQWW